MLLRYPGTDTFNFALLDFNALILSHPVLETKFDNRSYFSLDLREHQKQYHPFFITDANTTRAIAVEWQSPYKTFRIEKGRNLCTPEKVGVYIVELYPECIAIPTELG